MGFARKSTHTSKTAKIGEKKARAGWGGGGREKQMGEFRLAFMCLGGGSGGKLARHGR